LISATLGREALAIETHHYPEQDLTIFVLSGAPSAADILHAYREVKEGPGLTKHTIWDGRAAYFSHFSARDVQLLDQLIALIQNGRSSRSGGRSALLAGDVKDASVFRGLEKVNCLVPQRRKIVYSIEDALAWVDRGSPLPDESGGPLCANILN